MAHKRGHRGSAYDEPLTFGYNTNVYGDYAQQQIRLAQETARERERVKGLVDNLIAAETAKINALAADPNNAYTEGDRLGAIKSASDRIKNQVGEYRIPTTFDFSRIANVVKKDTFGQTSINRELQKEAKKKKQKFLD